MAHHPGRVVYSILPTSTDGEMSARVVLLLDAKGILVDFRIPSLAAPVRRNLDADAATEL